MFNKSTDTSDVGEIACSEIQLGRVMGFLVSNSLIDRFATAASYRHNSVPGCHELASDAKSQSAASTSNDDGEHQTRANLPEGVISIEGTNRIRAGTLCGAKAWRQLSRICSLSAARSISLAQPSRSTTSAITRAPVTGLRPDLTRDIRT